MKRAFVLATAAVLATLAVTGLSGATSVQAAASCSIDNRQEWGPIYDEGDCAVGTTIVRTNALWFCNVPLASLGNLPIRVVQTWTVATAVGQNGIELRTGCAGDGTPAIDLIVEQHLVGVGRISDPFKTRMSPGPQDVDVTGFLNASGPDATPGAGDHQDCIQLQGGDDNDFVNIDGCGDYDAGISNSQGAGGMVFYSLNDSHANVWGGEYIGCNHGLYPDPREVGPGMRASRVVDAKFRTGNNTTAWCSNFNTSPACTGALSELAELSNVSCQRYINGQWIEQGNPNPPPPPPPTPPPALTICAETTLTFVLCWPELSSVASYNFYRDDVRVSNSNDGARTRVRFGKVSGTHSYSVEAVYATGQLARSTMVLTW